jgi:hypothetical protein
VSSNYLSQAERVEIGKKREALILDALNETPIQFRGEKINKWVNSSATDDMRNKIDAWAIYGNDSEFSVQIKYRETGGDLGIACVRPWESHHWFCKAFESKSLPLDRDLKSNVDIYVCNYNNKIIVADGKIVKNACWKMMDKLAQSKWGFRDYTFTVPEYRGAELRLVTDRGSEGYSSGQKKIICYISPALLARVGGSIVNDFN